MRLICTIDSSEGDENPDVFQAYLYSLNIATQGEKVEGGKVRIWVVNEDQVERAFQEYSEYKKNPTAERFQNIPPAEPTLSLPEAPPSSPKRKSPFALSSSNFVTTGIIALCVLLFFWAQTERTQLVPPKIPGIIQAPVLPEVEHSLLFDYPTYFSLRDKLLKIYPLKEIKDKLPPSPEAEQLIEQIQATPVWMGAYDLVVQYFKTGKAKIHENVFLFSDIRAGEFWRLFTPALLHFDLLHIFFNLMWFILLGNQIEPRLGWFRYSFLIIIIGIVSNTGQYLVSGPFFMGLSGVVCGLAAFIWARQQLAPWEGYLLQRFTLIFLSIFVFGLMLLQTSFFIFDILDFFDASLPIANTAHIIGGIVGYLCGRCDSIFKIRETV